MFKWNIKFHVYVYYFFILYTKLMRQMRPIPHLTWNPQLFKDMEFVHLLILNWIINFQSSWGEVGKPSFCVCHFVFYIALQKAVMCTLPIHHTDEKKLWCNSWLCNLDIVNGRLFITRIFWRPAGVQVMGEKKEKRPFRVMDLLSKWICHYFAALSGIKGFIFH